MSKKNEIKEIRNGIFKSFINKMFCTTSYIDMEWMFMGCLIYKFKGLLVAFSFTSKLVTNFFSLTFR